MFHSSSIPVKDLLATMFTVGGEDDCPEIFESVLSLEEYGNSKLYILCNIKQITHNFKLSYIFPPRTKNDTSSEGHLNFEATLI